jgi:hypothetical protein
MDFSEIECKRHRYKITSICTQDDCDQKLLCDLCVNNHTKTHRYLISVNSITNNFYEKMISTNKESFKAFDTNFISKYEEIINMLENNYELLLSDIIKLVESNKKVLIENLENFKNSFINNEISIWNELKINYEKYYIKLLTESNNFYPSMREDETNESNDENNFINFLKIVNKTLEKQSEYNAFENENLEEVKKKLLIEFNQSLKSTIKNGLDSLKESLNKLSSECNLLVTDNGLGISPNSNIIKIPKNINFNKNFRSTSPFVVNNKSRNKIESRSIIDTSINEIDNPNIQKLLLESEEIKNLKFDEVENIFIEKKKGWYSLDYIEELDWVVCGYHSGEIVIFRREDSVPIKTLRPRFKRIRKLFYSPENFSIFTSYDDGNLVVISVSDFKIFHHKLSSAQIYSLEIMTTQNILLFGGAEKKIMYSKISNLDKLFLFHESNYGEIQCLLYDEYRDILISGFRKNYLVFFKFAENNILKEYKFSGNDNCPMVCKKFREDLVMTCGYFLKVHLFKISENIEILDSFEFGYLHLYDFIPVSMNCFLFSTFDDGDLVLYDIEKKKVVNKYTGFNGVVQIRKAKNFFYFTSHSENLRKVRYNTIL